MVKPVQGRINSCFNTIFVCICHLDPGRRSEKYQVSPTEFEIKLGKYFKISRNLLTDSGSTLHTGGHNMPIFVVNIVGELAYFLSLTQATELLNNESSNRLFSARALKNRFSFRDKFSGTRCYDKSFGRSKIMFHNWETFGSKQF